MKAIRSALAFALLALCACPGDTTPPTAAIISPPDGSTVSGLVLVSCQTSDNRSVRAVEFYVNDTLRSRITTDSAGIFTWQWDTRPLDLGSRQTLHCVASDAVGNRGQSNPVVVTIGTTAATSHSGTITTPETWSPADNPHFIAGNLTVESRLTILPGTRIWIAAGTKITVGTRSPAGLDAIGRPDSVIIVTALDSSLPWRSFEFKDQTVNSTLEHCSFSHGGADAVAMISCASPLVAIRDCQLRASRSNGIWADSTLSAFERNRISDCAGLPVRVGPAGLSSIGSGNLFAGNHRNAVAVGGGRVTSSDTWPAPGYPLYFTGTVTIAGPARPTIVIAPGCSLLFADTARLRIGLAAPGGLRADGAYGRIVFSSFAAPPGPGRWGGIEFWEQTDSLRSLLRLCTIEYAGAGGSAAVSLVGAPTVISNCIIRASAGDGVQCLGTGPRQFDYNTVTSCGGPPLRLPADRVSALGPGNSLGGNARDVVAVTATPIRQRSEWRNLRIPYAISGVIDVGAAEPATLLIEQGSTLNFEPGAGLRVGYGSSGELIAIGDPDSVVFTGTSTRPGHWRGIELHPGCLNTTRLERCRILYAGGGDRGNLLIAGCEPVVRSCEIGWSSNYCIWLQESELDADSLRHYNWLHDWASGFEDIYDDGR